VSTVYTHKGNKYHFKFVCKYCGKTSYSNREWQKFCSQPEKCRELYWMEIRGKSQKVGSRLAKLEDEVRKIRDEQK